MVHKFVEELCMIMIFMDEVFHCEGEVRAFTAWVVSCGEDFGLGRVGYEDVVAAFG